MWTKIERIVQGFRKRQNIQCVKIKAVVSNSSNRPLITLHITLFLNGICSIINWRRAVCHFGYELLSYCTYKIPSCIFCDCTYLCSNILCIVFSKSFGFNQEADSFHERLFSCRWTCQQGFLNTAAKNTEKKFYYCAHLNFLVSLLYYVIV